MVYLIIVLIFLGVVSFSTVFQRLSIIDQQNQDLEATIAGLKDSFFEKQRALEEDKIDTIYIELETKIKENNKTIKTITNGFSLFSNEDFDFTSDLHSDGRIWGFLGVYEDWPNDAPPQGWYRIECLYKYNAFDELILKETLTYDDHNQLSENVSIKFEKSILDNNTIETTYKNDEIFSLNNTILDEHQKKIETVSDEKNNEFKSGKTLFTYDNDDKLISELFFEKELDSTFKEDPCYQVDYFYYTSSNKLLKELHVNHTDADSEIIEVTLYAYKGQATSWELVYEILHLPIKVRDFILTVLAFYGKCENDLVFRIYNRTNMEISIIQEEEIVEKDKHKY